MQKLVRVGLVAVLAALVVLGAAACGDDSDDSASSTPATSTAAGGDTLVAAQARIDDWSRVKDVKFPLPDGPVTPGKKKVALIMLGQDEVFTTLAAQAKEAAAAIGWQISPPLDGQFNPAVVSGYIQQAINEKYDAIILLVVDAPTVAAALDAAAAAKIPVACVLCAANIPGYEGKLIDSSVDGKESGKTIAAFTAVESADAAKVLLLDDTTFGLATQRTAGYREGLKEYCPGCKIVDEVKIQAPEAAQPGPPPWTAALAANPPGTFDYAAFPYDTYAVPAAKTAKEQGRTDFTITGYDGSHEMVEFIAAGNDVAKATISAPFEFNTWAAFDLLARKLAGQELWDASAAPARLVVQDNAKDFVGGFYVPDFSVPDTFTAYWK